jgi:ABC-type Fe3+-hydroxamate transport system substrate-binding protein
LLTQKEPSDSIKALLNQNDIPVVVIPAAQNYDGLSELYQSIGKIFLGSKSGSAKGLSHMTSISNKLDNIKQTVLSNNLNSTQYKVIYIADSFGHVATGDTVINHILTSAGGINAAENAIDWKADGSILGLADFIFCPNTLVDKVKNIDGLKNSPAVKNNKIFEIEAGSIESQGFRMIEAAQKIASTLYPEAFTETTTITSLETGTTITNNSAE